MGPRRRVSDRMNLLSLLKALGIALGVMGGTITVGDRLWADKSEVVAIKTKVEAVEKQIDKKFDAVEKKIDKIDGQVGFMYKAFLEAASHASHTRN